MPETELDMDAHPLVATPSILTRGNRLPSAAGQRQPTGRLRAGTTNTMVAIAEALFASNDGPCPPERIRWVRAELIDFLGRAPGRSRLMFGAGAFLISMIAPILVGRFPPFRRLSLDDRIAALRKIEPRRIGAAYIALKAILCLIYYEHPDAARDAGIVLGPDGRPI